MPNLFIADTKGMEEGIGGILSTAKAESGRK
jgi:hypothetical protein